MRAIVVLLFDECSVPYTFVFTWVRYLVEGSMASGSNGSDSEFLQRRLIF